MMAHLKSLLQGLGFLLIVVYTGWAYWPSLLDIPRGDQLVYLAEVSPQKDWGALAVSDYDLNRHRTFNPGDEILFRPLLYAFLGTEKFFFGYHFLLWQLVGILLHITVVYLILKLLLLMGQGLSAFLWAAFFGLFFINIELVTWHHLNSYLIFVVLILVSLNQVYRILVDRAPLFPRFWYMIAALAPACFIYEAANLYSVLIAVFLWFYRRDARRYVGWILLPVAIYTATSLINLFIFHPCINGFSRAFNWNDILVCSTDLAKTMAWWIYVGFFRDQYLFILEFATRTHMPLDDVLAFKKLSWFMPSVVLTASGIALYGVILLLTVNRAFLRNRGPFLGLMAGMIFIYCLVIVIGREQTGVLKNVLGFGLYYMYIFWAWLFILIYACIDFNKSNQRILYRSMKIISATVLVMLIILNAQMLHMANNMRAKDSMNSIRLVGTLEALIQQKGKEKDFSFFVNEKYPGNFIYPDATNRFDGKRRYSFVELLYPSYSRSSAQAKYRF